MGRNARHVYCDPRRIGELEALARRLRAGCRVRVHQRDGAIVEGIVAEQPVVQVFLDDEGREGSNAIVRLEEPDVLPFDRYVWLDQIERVEVLDLAT